MKLSTHNPYVSGHCWKGFQCQRSNVKVIARPMHPCGGGIHFDGVTLRLTCIYNIHIMYLVTMLSF